jgi:hypothetical protein
MNNNPRRRFKNLLPTSDERPARGQVPPPAPAPSRSIDQRPLDQRPVDKQPASKGSVDKAAGSAEFFADFLAAFMTLSPDKLADWE